METHLIQFSLVVAGRAHNPSILNPDFLRLNGIVPADWNWEVAETVTTPPLALVRYTNGIAITVDHNKLQVLDVSDNPMPGKSKAAVIAQRYVETLPHVPCVAVGNNFQCVVPMENPGAFLRSRFLKSGPWDSGTPALQEAGVRLVYPLPDGRLVLSLDAGKAEKLDGANTVGQSVLLMNANFHRDCGRYPAKDQVLGYLTQAPSDYNVYKALVARVLE